MSASQSEVNVIGEIADTGEPSVMKVFSTVSDVRFIIGIAENNNVGVRVMSGVLDGWYLGYQGISIVRQDPLEIQYNLNVLTPEQVPVQVTDENIEEYRDLANEIFDELVKMMYSRAAELVMQTAQATEAMSVAAENAENTEDAEGRIILEGPLP